MLTQIYIDKNGPVAVSHSNPLPVTVVAGSFEFSENANSNNATVPVMLVAGQTGKSIVVNSLFYSTQGATQLTLVDSAGTALLGPIYLAANAHGSLPVSVVVASGLSLMFKTSTATNITVAVSGNTV